MEGRITHEKITKLEPGQIFVFGSNQSGRHGKGAAKQALT
jgi:poly(A) polymerase Pap1